MVDPLCDWLRREHGADVPMLIHEEVRGRGGRRPDLLVVVSSAECTSINDVTLISVEIENSSHGAIHDPRNGLRQLGKYPAHLKYLAIPRTVAMHEAAKEIPDRCARWKAGLLVVEHASGDVRCEVTPVLQSAARTLRAYPVAMRRWIALRESSDVFRRISGGRIVERE